MAKRRIGKDKTIARLPNRKTARRKIGEEADQVVGNDAPEDLSAEEHNAQWRKALVHAFDNVMTTLMKVRDKHHPPPSRMEVNHAIHLLGLCGREILKSEEGMVSESTRKYLEKEFKKERARIAGRISGDKRREKRSWVAPFEIFCIEKLREDPTLSMERLVRLATLGLECELPGDQTLKKHLREMNKEGRLP